MKSKKEEVKPEVQAVEQVVVEQKEVSVIYKIWRIMTFPIWRTSDFVNKYWDDYKQASKKHMLWEVLVLSPMFYLTAIGVITIGNNFNNRYMLKTRVDMLKNPTAFVQGIKTVYVAQAATTTNEEFKRVVPPLLKRIACGESGNNHLDPKTGQVLINKTLDVGKYQINVKIWGKKATELGYNLYNEADNEAMAIWIYNEKGADEWLAKPSAKCK